MLHRFFAHTSSKTSANVKGTSLLTALVLTLAVLLAFTPRTANAQKAGREFPTGKVPVPSTTASQLAGIQLNNANVHAQSGFGQNPHPNGGGGIKAKFLNFQQTLPISMGSGAYYEAIAPDNQGNLFVGDYFSGNVFKETPNGAGGFTQTLLFTLPIQGPTAIAIDAAGNLYIANDQTAQVFFAQNNGNGTYATPTAIATGSPLKSAYDLSLDGNDDIFIADWGAHGIFEMAYNSNTHTWAAPALIYSSGYPLGVAVDAYGQNIYVADNSTANIFEISNGGGTWNFNHNIGTNVNVGGWGAVVLGNDQSLYALSNNANALYKFSPAQNDPSGYVATEVSNQFNYPQGLAIDNKGTVFVGDEGAGIYYGFINGFGQQPVGTTSTSTVVANFYLYGTGSTGQASVVTTGTTQGMNAFSIAPGTDTCSNITPAVSGQFCSITVNFTPNTVGRLTGAVSIFDNVGNDLWDSVSFHGKGLGSTSTILPGTYSYFGGLYTASKNAPSIAPMRQKEHLKTPKVQKNGNPQFTLSNGTYPGAAPTGIAVDNFGDVFVADTYTCNIYATFDWQNWITLPMFSILCPSGGLAVDGSGNVFFTAWYNNSGTSEAAVAVDYRLDTAYFDAVAGTEVPATYVYPSYVAIYTDAAQSLPLLHTDAVAVDGSDNVYFSGSDNSYLNDYVYKVPANNYDLSNSAPYAIQKLPAPYNSKDGNNEFQYASGLAADNSGNVFVTDYQTGTVYEEVPSAERYNVQWVANNFDTPTAVSVTNSGDLYVLDSGDDSGVSALYLLEPSGNYTNTVPLVASPYTAYGMPYLWNMSVDNYNDFWFTDFGTFGGLITYVDTFDPMTTNFAATTVGVESTDSPEFAYIYNSGTQTLNFTQPATGENPSVPANYLLNTQSMAYMPGSTIPVGDCAQLPNGGSFAVLADSACAMPLTFDPMTAGTSAGTVVLTTDSATSGNIGIPVQKDHSGAALPSGSKPKKNGGIGFAQNVVNVNGTAAQVVPNVVLLSNWNDSLVQNSVTFAINVTGPGATPTGTVTLTDGVTSVGTGTLFQGATTINVTFITAGAHNMTATYSGDANYMTATALLVQNVDDFAFNFSVGGGASPTFCQSAPIVSAGQTVVLGFSIAPVAPATTIPGAITFTADGAPVGTNYVFAPVTIAAGAGSTPVTLALTIPQQFVADLNQPKNNNGGKLPIAPLALAVLLLPLAGRMRKAGKRLVRMLSIALFILAGISTTAALSGCGANTKAYYDVVITAQSGSLFHTSSCQIIVK